jgi:HD-GYP domain-containing protein (c-di-GMP phosphodiesterase class II)
MNPARIKAMDQCLRQLTTAVSTASLYSARHQQVLRLCRNAYGLLNEALAEELALSVMRVDDQLAVDGQPLVSSLYIDRFARMLKTRGIGHVKFLREVSVEELQGLIGALARRDATVHSSDHLRLGQVEVRYRNPSAGSSRFSSQVSQLLDDVSSEELAKIMEVYDAVSHNRKLNVVGLSEIVAEFVDIFSSYADPLLTLVPLRSMDEYTFTHSLNVCLLNIGQATALGIDGPLLHDIGLSAMLHDIGKLFLPEEVLNKTGRLNSEEWELLKEHPVKGAEYLVKTPGVPRMAVANAYEHHMRFDQRGYPTVRKDWQQSLSSQITAISDTYDALRTHRPYRTPMGVDEILVNISNLVGTQLHPLLVENFLRLMKKVHPGH